MSNQKSFLSVFRDLQKHDFPEIKTLRKAISGVNKKVASELEIPKKHNTTLVALSLKNIYFISYAIRYLVQNLKSQKGRDLEENLIVQIEVQLQLLSAQLESTVFGDDESYERSEAVLGVLLNNQFREIGAIFQELKMLSAQNKNSELISVVESLIVVFNALNKKLADEAVDTNLIDLQ